MAGTAEWWWLIGLLVLVGMPAVFGVTALVRYGLAVMRRPYLKTQTSSLSCPRTGADVECAMVLDVRSGKWVEVRECSRFGGRATCEQACVAILNRGIPLRSSRSLVQQGAPGSTSGAEAGGDRDSPAGAGIGASIKNSIH
jgi:hypothetical protein